MQALRCAAVSSCASAAWEVQSKATIRIARSMVISFLLMMWRRSSASRNLGKIRQSAFLRLDRDVVVLKLAHIAVRTMHSGPFRRAARRDHGETQKQVA